MSYAVLFSGQGMQHAGMLPWLEAAPACRKVLADMADATGDGWRATLNDPQRRSVNAFAQPLIVGTGLAAWTALQGNLNERPAVVSGYSVGELSAYACAGVISAKTAISLAVQRAAWMDSAVAGVDTGLLSINGKPMAAVLNACDGLECAIEIAEDQGIYAGESIALDVCAWNMTAQGALCKRLDVRVASHSRWMQRAANGFALDLAITSFEPPLAPVALNATGSVTRQAPVLREALSQQIASTVRWAACMDAVAERGVHCVIEIGAGTSLSKMWNQRHPDIPARSIDEFQNAKGAAEWIARC